MVEDHVEDYDEIPYIQDLSTQILHECPNCNEPTKYVDTMYRGKYVRHNICPNYKCGAEFYSRG